MALVFVGTVIAALLGTAGAEATFPGQNGELMYAWSDASGKAMYSYSGIQAVDIGTGARENALDCMWQGGAGCFVYEGSVSADGGRMAIAIADSTLDASTGFSKTDHRLAIVTLGSGEERSLPLSSPTFDPAWSPNGDELLVTRYGGLSGERGDGSPQVLLIDASDGRELGPAIPGTGSEADWAVTGEIAYVRDGNIWAARPNEPSRQLTTEGGESPSWSPDGSGLAFVRDGRIWTMRVDGSDEQMLPPTDALTPTWSPDGRYIAFSRVTSSFAISLWVMHADGLCARAVRPAGVWSSFTRPFWRPLPGPADAGRPPCGAQPLTRPDLTRAASRLRARRATLRYRVGTMPRIGGRAVFRTRLKAAVPTSRGLRRRHLTLARVRFTAGPRGVARLRHRLSPRAMRVLRRNGALHLRAVVRVSDEAGDSATASRRLTLIAPRPSRSAKPG